MEAKRVMTVRDAMREKIESEQAAGIEDRADCYKLPEYIGTLCRNGVTVHYAYIRGEYREGDVEHLKSLHESTK